MGKKAIVGNCTGLFGNVTRLYANVEAHGELCTVEVFLGSDDQHDAAAEAYLHIHVFLLLNFGKT